MSTSTQTIELHPVAPVNRKPSSLQLAERNASITEADENQTPTNAVAFEQLEKWNYPRRNVVRMIASCWGFIIMGMNDAAVGVRYLRSFTNTLLTCVVGFDSICKYYDIGNTDYILIELAGNLLFYQLHYCLAPLPLSHHRLHLLRAAHRPGPPAVRPPRRRNHHWNLPYYCLRGDLHPPWQVPCLDSTHVYRRAWQRTGGRGVECMGEQLGKA
jgi:hypothetical protein